MPSLEYVKRANSSIFTTHGLSGFTAGLYHELFVDLQYSYEYKSPLVTYRSGSIEASFGYATPLASFLFEAHRSKYFGNWSDINTLRIVGANVEEVEAVIINVFDNYASQFKILPTLLEMDDSFIYDFDRDEVFKKHKPKVVTVPPFTMNLEPLRFFTQAYHRATMAPHVFISIECWNISHF